ncbi:MAG TPA: shikimate dehydrogenase [Aquificaceae bacterium]|nr:shikimate dehydrogenase [Aquificaceae bacterium]
MNITGKTALYGIIGYPVKHSLSPVFQNSAFSYMGLDAVYVPFEVKREDLSRAVEGLRLAGVKGLNVTVPHKEAVLELANFLSKEVKSIGAANTLKFSDRGVEAYNTDWIGFSKAIAEITSLEGKSVLVLGAGGSSRAVLYALKKERCRILLWNRTRERAEHLAEEFGAEVAGDVRDALPFADVVVNTTSVGLKEEDPPLFDYDLLSERHIVVDVIYKETRLIKAAKSKGCLYRTGFPMLLYQGAESFKIWTGCEPPLEVMKRSLIAYGYRSLG